MSGTTKESESIIHHSHVNVDDNDTDNADVNDSHTDQDEAMRIVEEANGNGNHNENDNGNDTHPASRALSPSRSIVPMSEFQSRQINSEALSQLKRWDVKKFYTDQNQRIEKYAAAYQHHRRHVKRYHDQNKNRIAADNEQELLLSSSVNINDNDPQHVDDAIDDEEYFSVANDVRDRRQREEAKVEFVVKLSFYLTFLILAIKSYTAARTGSIAVISICVDSGLDLLSQFIMLLSTRLIRTVDLNKYPSGKSRMEPTGVVVFSCIMGMSAVVLLVESAQQLVDDLSAHTPRVFIDHVSIALIAIVVCIQLAEYLYCRMISKQTNENASVNAIAMDHMNDVVINGIGGIPAVFAGYYPAYRWLDPAGGICLSLYIMYRWATSAIEMIPSLIGRTADSHVLSELTYLCCIHSPDKIKRIDTVLAYYNGPRLQVEVHIVLPSDMSLREAHDIGESLEIKIEEMETVEMAFVHLDYETDHALEHGRGNSNRGKAASPSENHQQQQQPQEQELREQGIAIPIRQATES